jgi:hypothetical protein
MGTATAFARRLAWEIHTWMAWAGQPEALYPSAFHNLDTHYFLMTTYQACYISNSQLLFKLDIPKK